MNNSTKKFMPFASRWTGLVLLAVIGLSGCSDDNHAPPPTERSKLVLRLFKSMRNTEIDDAINQAEKINDIADTLNRPYLKRIIYTQNANLSITEAQKALDKGSIAEAAEAIKKGLSNTPNNPVLLELSELLTEQITILRLTGDLQRFYQQPSVRQPLVADLQRRLASSSDAKLKGASNRLAMISDLDNRFRNLRVLTADLATFELLAEENELNAALYTTILAERELESVKP